VLAPPKTHLAARQPNDTGAAGLNHLDIRPVTESQLFKTMNLFGPATDLKNAGQLAVAQII
jgi:hypothetical protein